MGVPQQIIDRLLAGHFSHVTGENILAEVRRNAIGKLRLTPRLVDVVLEDIQAMSSVYVPSGKRQYIAHAKDNLVLEVALSGACTVLVSGDRKHLLPLSPFRDGHRTAVRLLETIAIASVRRGDDAWETWASAKRPHLPTSKGVSDTHGTRQQRKGTEALGVRSNGLNCPEYVTL